MNIGISAVGYSRLKNITLPDELTRDLRRADDFIRLAVCAAHEILQSEKIEKDHRGESFGLIVGTGFGTMQTNFEVLDSVIFGGQTSPTVFSHSVFNAAAGYAAAVLNLQGCGLTITDFSFPFFRALQEARLAIASGRVSRCLALQVETYSELFHDAREKETETTAAWEPGVVCWLLEQETMREDFLVKLDTLDIVDRRYAPEAIICWREEVEIDDKKIICNDPLDATFQISQAIRQVHAGEIRACTVHAPWGKVGLEFS
jgi:hypothetical protein